MIIACFTLGARSAPMPFSHPHSREKRVASFHMLIRPRLIGPEYLFAHTLTVLDLLWGAFPIQAVV